MPRSGHGSRVGTHTARRDVEKKYDSGLKNGDKWTYYCRVSEGKKQTLFQEKYAENFNPLNSLKLKKKVWYFNITHRHFRPKVFLSNFPLVKTIFSLISSEQNDLIDQTILDTHFQSKETFLSSDLDLFDKNPFPLLPPCQKSLFTPLF